MAFVWEMYSNVRNCKQDVFLCWLSL